MDTEEEADKYSRCVSRNRTQTLLGGQQTAALREGTYTRRVRFPYVRAIL